MSEQGRNARFTRIEVETEARKKYDGIIHMSALDEAMQEESLADAVELFICECQYINKKAGH